MTRLFWGTRNVAAARLVAGSPSAAVLLQMIGAVAWVVVASGCYLSHGGPSWDPEAQTIGIPPVVSHLRSDELTRSVEARLTTELRRRASQGDLGGLRFAPAGDCDVGLEVEVVGVQQRVIRSDLYNVPLERQVVIQTRYKLTRHYGPPLAQGHADSRVSALAGDYDISRGQDLEQGRTSAIESAAQSIIEAIDEERTRPAKPAARAGSVSGGAATAGAPAAPVSPLPVPAGPAPVAPVPGNDDPPPAFEPVTP